MTVRTPVLSLLFGLVLCPPSTAQEIPPTCDELVYYRDNELVQRWDVAMAGVKGGYQGIEYMHQVRNELDGGLLDQWARSSGPQVAQAIRSITDAIGDLVDIGTGGNLIGASRDMAQKVTLGSAQVLFALEAGKQVEYLVDYQTEVAASRILASRVPYLGGAVNLGWNLAENLNQMQRIQAETGELWVVVMGWMDRVEAELVEYRALLNSSQEAADALEAIKIGIDEYCGHSF